MLGGDCTHAVHGRFLYDPSGAADRVAFCQPGHDQRGAILDPDLVLDQRHLVHREQPQRLGDIGLGRRLPERDDVLFGHLHRR
jgi:hypothetical protein